MQGLQSYWRLCSIRKRPKISKVSSTDFVETISHTGTVRMFERKWCLVGEEIRWSTATAESRNDVEYTLKRIIWRAWVRKLEVNNVLHVP